MKLKVNSQVSDTIISLASLSQINLKEGPPSPDGPNLGPYAPLRLGYLRLGLVMLGSVPPETPLTSIVRIELSVISLEIYVFAPSFLQFH